MKKKIKELLLTIVCLMNASKSNDEIYEVMKLIEKFAGSSLSLWRKFSDERKGTRKVAILSLKKQLIKL